MKLQKKSMLALVPIAVMVLSSLVFWRYLPDQLPIHLDGRGLVDTFARTDQVLLGLPIMYVAVVMLFASFERISRRFSQDAGILSTSQFSFTLGLVFLFLQFNIFAYGMGIHKRGFALDQLILGIVFIFLGRLAKAIDRNRWVGIRLPWTLHSPSNWKATHDLWGKLLIAIGSLSILFSPWLPDASLALYSGLLSTLLAIVYSSVRALRAKAQR